MRAEGVGRLRDEAVPPPRVDRRRSGNAKLMAGFLKAKLVVQPGDGVACEHALADAVHRQSERNREACDFTRVDEGAHGPVVHSALATKRLHEPDVAFGEIDERKRRRRFVGCRRSERPWPDARDPLAVRQELRISRAILEDRILCSEVVTAASGDMEALLRERPARRTMTRDSPIDVVQKEQGRPSAWFTCMSTLPPEGRGKGRSNHGAEREKC